MSVSSTHATPASAALRAGAAEEPDRIALEIDDRRISYVELNEQADRLAQRLAADRDGSERVALRANGTHQLAVGFLAIQRAGLVSVPIDPTAPPERLRLILGDVEPRILLSDVAGDEDLGLSVPVSNPLSFGADLTPTPIDRRRDRLASIVYTSGSTGTPKGIMVGTDQVEAQYAALDGFGLMAGARIGGITAGTVSYIEQVIASFLVFRGTLVSYEIRRHGLSALGPWIERSQIVIFATVPTVLRHLLATIAAEQRFPCLRMVILSGETATGADVMRFRPHLPDEAVIVNSFGLTESNGLASLVIPSDMPLGPGPLPAGQISPQIELTIADPDGRPLPPGEPGEIIVRGHAFASGYWRRPDLTRAAFRELDDGRRELRTGDGGRLRPDGMLEHLGRLDHLVKISGNRVELGEVEDALTRLDDVVAAAAASYTDQAGNTRLAACVVPAPGARLESRLLRAALARRLPGYMVPVRFAVVDALPQLPGGKVDRGLVATLPAAESRGGEERLSELERALAEIWRKTLKVDRVGRDDDFFAIGGDSLDAARMFAEIDASLGIDRPVSLLVEAPTLAALALMLEAEAPAWDAILAVRTEGGRPPLFVVHDGIGSVLYARGLAASLGADQPIYGLRCEGLDGTAPREGSLAELAATYVDRIQALYPAGPYLLYGVSLGGIVAIEMARQLIESGEQVPLVVLGDSHAPGVEVRPRSKDELDYHVGRMRHLTLAERGRYLRAVLGPKVDWLLSREGRTMRREDRELDLVLERGKPVPASLRGRFVVREYGRLLAGHQARPPFPERTLLLRVGSSGDGPDRGWGPLLGSSLQVVGVPGSHNDLGREASGAYVGPVIRHVLERTIEPASVREPLPLA
jgi:acyl-coenzyme A synthetase/AMP-(fatty) acid ligase/thioesterase domain-containing protein